VVELRNLPGSSGLGRALKLLAFVGALCAFLQAPARAQFQAERPLALSTKPKKIADLPGGALGVEHRLREATAERRAIAGLAADPLQSENLSLFAVQISTARSQRVVPPGDGPGSQGPTLVGIGTNSGLPHELAKETATRLGALQSASCAQEIVDGLDSAQRAVRAVPVDDLDIPPDDRLYRWLLKSRGAERETSLSISALAQLESAWKSMLSKCFAAPQTRPLFSKVAGRVGAFSAAGGPPFCTGTLLEDGKILTARHCFFDFASGTLIEPHLKELTFLVADKSAVLTISPVALRASGTNRFDATGDWIVIDAPKLNKAIPKLGLARTFRDFSEAAKTKTTPTPLELFSVVPLASTLDPAKFPASIVGFPVAGCYVVFVQPQCITHMCGVVPGGSGASIFVDSSSEPTWAALHIGPETVDNGSCSATPEPVASNLGIRGVSAIESYFHY
jgi:hypothetical protein